MGGKNRITENFGIICFSTIWCTITFGIGILFLQIAQSSENPPPILFLIITTVICFGLGFFVLVLCVSEVRSGEKQETPAITRHHSEDIASSRDYSITPEPVVQIRYEKSIYQMPTKCPSCGAAISTEEVDWVGPLQAKCPYCNATVDSQEKVL